MAKNKLTIEDHPRLCGEKPAMHGFPAMHGGSPPPMRGKGKPILSVCCRVGITPAYAGKSKPAEIKSNVFGDHPRLCGEKLTVAIYSHLFSGSPPPMRGKAPPMFSMLFVIRITPAYAGKSACQNQTGQKIEDHPRLCGEKHSKTSPMPVRCRITPAYAGKSRR